MFIEPISCPGCGARGRPGGSEFQFSSIGEHQSLRCRCGSTFSIDDIPFLKDQHILSDNRFMVLDALSNYNEIGQISVTPGVVFDLQFKREVDIPCAIYFGGGKLPLTLKEFNLNSKGCKVASSFYKGDYTSAGPVTVDWHIYGLVDFDSLPTWYIHFYNAFSQTQHLLFKSALIDYAVSFEVFIGTFCNQLLMQKMGEDSTKILLRRFARIEDQCKDLMRLACGFALTERDDVYHPWDCNVRDLRNRLAHGEQIRISHEDACAAHSAVYQAIRWVQERHANRV